MVELRVLVVADDPLARAGLAAMLSTRPECLVVGQVTSGDELADEVAVYRPDVVLWDLGWDPAANLALDLAQTLSIPVVGLLPDETQVVDALSAGISGLLFRETSGDALLVALLAVEQGLMVLDPELAAAALPLSGPSSELPIEELTPRELEVLQLLAEGLSNKAIAQRLEISDHTVKFHVNAIMGKLGAQSRTEAVVRATRQGLIIL